MKPKKRYKFLRTGLTSHYGEHKWKMNKWYTVDKDKLCMCENGFHCSTKIIDAFNWVQGEWLCVVEVKGVSIIEECKECWSEMRIVEKHRWAKKDSVKLAIFAAEQCLKYFKEEYPDDKRPREAIEAAKRWLKNPTAKNREAAGNTREAAWSAGNAAWSALEKYLHQRLEERR